MVSYTHAQKTRRCGSYFEELLWGLVQHRILWWTLIRTLELINYPKLFKIFEKSLHVEVKLLFETRVTDFVIKNNEMQGLSFKMVM